jgi:signal transduction histidine kinase
MNDIDFPGLLDDVFPAQAALPLASSGLAHAGRDTSAEFDQKSAILDRLPLVQSVLDAMPNMVMILNRNRQIVAANRKLRDILGANLGELVEKRPGEAIHCIRVAEGPDGCGTSEHCAHCGAFSAVIESMASNAQTVRECRILSQTAHGIVPLDLRVTATPFAAEEERFTLMAIEDISYEKHSAVLQRAFFHDVLNTAGCVQGYADYLASESSADREVCQRLSCLAGQLIEEIQFQRELLRAESGDLKTQPVPLKASQVLYDLRTQYLKHPAAENRDIFMGPMCDGAIIADWQLLHRVLGNMLKNALEATSPGGKATLSCQDDGAAVTFEISNPEVMPRGVQLQVFQRSFSTKNQAGRGMGTYSMKLFGERYLNGSVGFVSRPPEGTTFWLRIPRTPLGDVNRTAENDNRGPSRQRQ